MSSASFGWVIDCHRGEKKGYAEEFSEQKLGIMNLL